MEETFGLWEDDRHGSAGEVVIGLDPSHPGAYSTLGPDNMIAVTDQIAAENLMFLSQDVVYTETATLDNEEFVTEEIITDDWTPGGQERVEVPLEHLTNPVLDLKQENDVDVPLPTVQDEYTAMRPFPCDFCSRRFRKKASLMNHMVAHQKDRPHACNLCGVRYTRRSDLMTHFKVHAFVPDDGQYGDEPHENDNSFVMQKKKRGRRRKPDPEPEPEPEEEEDDGWENMTSARTQQWLRRPKSSPTPSSPASADSTASAATPPPPVDPRKPFVCNHCGVGFAREKALKSHSRIHGGDSPLECNACGELCWSREALVSHTRLRHPHLPKPSLRRQPSYTEDNSDDDMDFTLSPTHQSSESNHYVYEKIKGPDADLQCQDCGVAFQRADLLKRHVNAAHSHKRSGGVACNVCDVCGETCADALQLLAHAEGHARASHRYKKSNRGKHGPTSGTRQFPCKECGKVFGSRSSQQIHVRIHTGERPYACRFCWKAFADGGTLRKHERIHTGEKPYACAVCPRAFNQRVVLREHVRSHHSAPDYRIANGGPAFICGVCGRALHTSTELVHHLIQHCDANTAMKRQPQAGPRKYKRRKQFQYKAEDSAGTWRERSSTPVSPKPRRRMKVAAAATRPKMIHTEDPRARNKQLRPRRPPRHPADDLRAIQPHLSPSPPLPSPPLPSPPLPTSPLPSSPLPSSSLPCSPLPRSSPSPPCSPVFATQVIVKRESEDVFYKCEICDLEFTRRNDLLVHVPIHI